MGWILRDTCNCIRLGQTGPCSVPRPLCGPEQVTSLALGLRLLLYKQVRPEDANSLPGALGQRQREGLWPLGSERRAGGGWGQILGLPVPGQCPGGHFPPLGAKGSDCSPLPGFETGERGNTGQHPAQDKTHSHSSTGRSFPVAPALVHALQGTGVWLGCSPLGPRDRGQGSSRTGWLWPPRSPWSTLGPEALRAVSLGGQGAAGGGGKGRGRNRLSKARTESGCTCLTGEMTNGPSDLRGTVLGYTRCCGLVIHCCITNHPQTRQLKTATNTDPLTQFLWVRG